MEILSPKKEQTFFLGYDVPLIATLNEAVEGTYQWTITYLDDPAASNDSLREAIPCSLQRELAWLRSPRSSLMETIVSGQGSGLR